MTKIFQLAPNDFANHLDDLTDILHACVSDGASVSFVTPFSKADAEKFWQDKIFPKVQRSETLLFVAQVSGKSVGTVQLDIDMPPNQPHRCEVAKLLVHPNFRKQGLAKNLMQTLEQAARARDKTLITLDTRTADKAEPLYASIGYQAAGIIPKFAMNVAGDDYHATTYMYKVLD